MIVFAGCGYFCYVLGGYMCIYRCIYCHLNKARVCLFHAVEHYS